MSDRPPSAPTHPRPTIAGSAAETPRTRPTSAANPPERLEYHRRQTATVRPPTTTSTPTASPPNPALTAPPEYPGMSSTSTAQGSHRHIDTGSSFAGGADTGSAWAVPNIGVRVGRAPHDVATGRSTTRLSSSSASSVSTGCRRVRTRLLVLDRRLIRLLAARASIVPVDSPHPRPHSPSPWHQRC